MNYQSSSKTSKRISLYLIFNCCFMVFMVAAAFMIRSGQTAFLPHAQIDKQFVQAVIADGEPEAAWNALKHTEIARASGFRDVVGLMDLMQIASGVMALFFVVNACFLFRLRSAQPGSVPVMVRS